MKLLRHKVAVRVWPGVPLAPRPPLGDLLGVVKTGSTYSWVCTSPCHKAPASMPAAPASNLAMRTEQKASRRLNLCVELEVKTHDFPGGWRTITTYDYHPFLNWRGRYQGPWSMRAWVLGWSLFWPPFGTVHLTQQCVSSTTAIWLASKGFVQTIFERLGMTWVWLAPTYGTIPDNSHLRSSNLDVNRSQTNIPNSCWIELNLCCISMPVASVLVVWRHLPLSVRARAAAKAATKGATFRFLRPESSWFHQLKVAGLKQSKINRGLVWLLNICSKVQAFMDELANTFTQTYHQADWRVIALVGYVFFFFSREILWLSFSLPMQPDHKILFWSKKKWGKRIWIADSGKKIHANHAWRFLIYGYCGMACNWSRIFLDDSSVVFGVIILSCRRSCDEQLELTQQDSARIHSHPPQIGEARRKHIDPPIF